MDEWTERMHEGDFEAAWRLSDRALAFRPPADARTPRHEQRIWDGSPLAGRRVLVRCYHGLGDTIQFLRYLPTLGRLAREVTVWIQPELIDLLGGTPGLGRLIPLHDGAPGVDFDVDIEIMELPHAFRTVEGTIPRDVPYIHVTPATAPVSAKTRVGIVWTAGSWDPRRSVPFAEMESILSLPAVSYTPFEETVAASPYFGCERPKMTLARLAAHVASQDLVITVDTMMAHLAGALGVRTWVLLHSDADWRWMRARTDTPWYPRTTLYRQSDAGDWFRVLGAVRSDLVALSGGTHRSAGSEPDAVAVP